MGGKNGLSTLDELFENVLLPYRNSIKIQTKKGVTVHRKKA